jgi:cellulose synthase/poly-beta-1,6-N-acetylglucosamine synthase-like glycosyltransferase
MTIQVSVVIGTYNRAHLLQGTLEALASQAVPSSLKWEIVVVDNNSRDTTAQVAIARGVAQTVVATGVTVNSVLVGPTASEGASEFVQNMARQQAISAAEVEKQFFATIRPTSLLKRFETPEEIAAVVAFVASTQSVAINGAAVRAEAGVVQSIF